MNICDYGVSLCEFLSEATTGGGSSCTPPWPRVFTLINYYVSSDYVLDCFSLLFVRFIRLNTREAKTKYELLASTCPLQEEYRTP